MAADIIAAVTEKGRPWYACNVGRSATRNGECTGWPKK